MIDESTTTHLMGIHLRPDWHGGEQALRERVALRADQEGWRLTDAHWDVVKFLINLYADHGEELPEARELMERLDQHYAAEGGSRYLYTLFPHGPIGQICALTDLPLPRHARDIGMGVSY